MNIRPNSLEARDIAYHMHAYTNAAAHEQTGPVVMDRGEGVHVTDIHGKSYIEAMAGLWSVAVGFSEERLIKAAVDQMRKLPYYHNFAHRAHGPVIELAEKLIGLAPVPMSKVFFTNSGSEANDTVMKMLWYRANAMGQPQRKKFISRLRGYHGVTIGSASLTGLPNNHRSFDLPIAQVLHTSSPHYWKEGRDGESEEEFATRCANDLEALIDREGADTIAAMFAEPVMGAGGVVVPPATYWEKIQAVLKKHDILLVADEVICGFGRTGNWFGCQTYDIKPDVMVMSKQISSSYFPFSALMINDRVYDPIAEESGKIGVLGHGYTGGAHPVGAAISFENLKIIEERDLIAHATDVGELMRNGLAQNLERDVVGEVRGVGLIAAMELVNPDQDAAPGALGAKAGAIFMQNGVLSRNMYDAMAFCPPLIISRAETQDLLDRVNRSLDQLEAAL